jgi:integrase/recombinase XerD
LSQLFVSRLAGEMEQFLAFKRALGHKYLRAEFTLRAFDRFVRNYAPKHRSYRFEDALLAWLATKTACKPVSVTIDLGVIRQFCRHRQRRDPGAFVPGRTWAPQSTVSEFLPFIFTRAQVRVLLKMATPSPRRPGAGAEAMHLLLLILYCTGLRFGEAVRLKMGDVDPGRAILFVTESKGRSRWVPFHRSLARAIDRYLCHRRASRPASGTPEAPLLLQPDGRPFTVRWASDQVRQLLRRAGFKPRLGRIGPRPYDLRHTFAVHRLALWYRAGTDINRRLPWLSAYMGHLDILGTETYLTATPELLSLAGRRFRRRLSGRRACR